MPELHMSQSDQICLRVTRHTYNTTHNVIKKNMAIHLLTEVVLNMLYLIATRLKSICFLTFIRCFIGMSNTEWYNWKWISENFCMAKTLPDDLKYDTRLARIFLFTAMTFCLPTQHIKTFDRTFFQKCSCLCSS